MTEYECLAMNDDENVQENNLINEEYRSEMIEVDMVDNGEEQTTYFFYKYFFLQMRNDICIDKVGIKSLNAKFLPQKTSKQVSDQQDKINQKQKESVLITISNKVKLLEKNFTAQNNQLNRVEKQNSQTSADLKKILGSIVKAEEVFKDIAKDSERKDSKMSALNEKIELLETEMKKNEESLFVGLGFLASVMFCFVILNIIGCSCSGSENQNIPTQTQTASKNTSSVAVQTESNQLVKKVSFPDEQKCEEIKDIVEGEKEEASCGLKVTNAEDISRLLVTRRRKDVSRRVTWCPGTFRKLSTEARQLIKEM